MSWWPSLCRVKLQTLALRARSRSRIKRWPWRPWGRLYIVHLKSSTAKFTTKKYVNSQILWCPWNKEPTSTLRVLMRYIMHSTMSYSSDRWMFTALVCFCLQCALTDHYSSTFRHAGKEYAISFDWVYGFECVACLELSLVFHHAF